MGDNGGKPREMEAPEAGKYSTAIVWSELTTRRSLRAASVCVCGSCCLRVCVGHAARRLRSTLMPCDRTRAQAGRSKYRTAD